MILRSLEIRHFGKFPERTVEFRRGMNLVIGPNEAGKTTLMEAISAVLFGMGEGVGRFIPWGAHGQSGAVLVLEGGGRTLRVERHFPSDAVVSLTETDDLYQPVSAAEGITAPGRSPSQSEFLSLLSSRFGIAEEDLFRATLFFGQGDLKIQSRQHLAERIKVLLSGFVQTDYDQVLHAMRDEYATITRQSPWGEVREDDGELEEIGDQIKDLEQRWFETRTSFHEADELRCRIEELQAGIETDHGEYLKGERYLDRVRNEGQEAERQPAAPEGPDQSSLPADGSAELERRRETLCKEMERLGLPRDIPADLPDLLTEAEKIRKEMIGLQGESAQIRQQLIALGPNPWKKPALISLLLLAAGGAGAALITGWLTTILLGSGLLVAVVWIHYLLRAIRYHSELNRLKGQAQVLENRREDAQARLAELDERFQTFGMSPSAVQMVKLQKNLIRGRQITDELREIEMALQVLAAKGESNARAQLPPEETDKDVAPREVRRHGGLAPEEIPAAEEKLRALGEDIKEREALLLDLTRREAALHAALGDLQQIEEEGERLRERESSLLRRREVLATACELLSGVADEFRQTCLERFSGEISSSLEMVTGGRHGAVQLDDDFNIFLMDKDKNWQPAAHFSRGTIDALYFAVRIALARRLAHGRRLPLLLDDPLVHLDQSRQAEALSILERLAVEHQVIFFTHDDSVLKRAARERWHVISLDEGKSVHTPRKQERRDDVGQLHLL
jgi:DNA repair exonuclease SbcCD ATPase subunit